MGTVAHVTVFPLAVKRIVALPGLTSPIDDRSTWTLFAIFKPRRQLDILASWRPLCFCAIDFEIVR